MYLVIVFPICRLGSEFTRFADDPDLREKKQNYVCTTVWSTDPFTMNSLNSTSTLLQNSWISLHWLIMMTLKSYSKHCYTHFQQTNTCSKSTIKTLEKRDKYVLS